VRSKVSASQLQELRSINARLGDASAPLTRAELAASARTICALLGRTHPGGSVELRVPPFAAVQLGIGERGRHTRGTPPNVVQTDAGTLLELATGRLSWTDAITARRVQASGIHSDLSELWPLAELR